MIHPHPNIKQYASAKARMLKPTIQQFFAREFPNMFGPVMRSRLAEALLELFDSQHRSIAMLKPGQVLWNALDKRTRGDSPNRRFVPVVLTLVAEEDLQRRMEGKPLKEVAAHATARLLREAYQQGGLLSMRDLHLLTWRSRGGTATTWRTHYEQTHDCLLPHPGTLHDMGSCITHKPQIVYKVIVEKKDPAKVALETNHTQRAVDNYLKDYHRVKTVYQTNPDPEYIHMVTNIAKHVVNQYIQLIQDYENL
ncbi:DUF1670 domain-containing protein [Rhodohalobacter sp.]|uniref:DUF1670 domain-containing protein n=1 Tax=Rhodohalobacter sp. TaxID=1974210 RepID=UPI002ACD5A4C|nr:DUF1670 domain-containing protein [Rhodohalobacter sp.]MDZ7756606.1 DUF1670 domain-containing protein [Rhodohalobacter sp.]